MTRHPTPAHAKAALQASRAARNVKRREDRERLHLEAFRRYHSVLRALRFTVKVDEHASRHAAWIVELGPIPLDRQALDYWVRKNWLRWTELEGGGLRRYQVTEEGLMALEPAA